MPTTIIPTGTNGADVSRIPRFDGSEISIAIDNDDFDDAHDFLINKRQIDTLNFQIKNVGGSNDLSFEIYGSIDPSETAPPFALKDWELQNNGSGDVTSLTNQIFESQSYLVRLLIRLKRETLSQDTTCDILVTTGTR